MDSDFAKSLKSEILLSLKIEISAVIKSEMKNALADDFDFLKKELHALKAEVKNNTATICSEIDQIYRYIIVTGQLLSLWVILANIYAPNWDNPAFFSNLFSRLPNVASHHLILGVDINCVLSPSLDRSSSKKISLSKSAHTIQLFLKSYGIVDVWRFHNPTSRVVLGDMTIHIVGMIEKCLSCHFSSIVSNLILSIITIHISLNAAIV